MFLATSVSMQQEVKIGKDTQNMLIQKISNLLGSGEDNVSYKKAVEKLYKMQLEKVGTDRSREKPINIISKKIEKDKEEIEKLKNFENIKYEIEEEKNEIKNELKKNEIKNELLKNIKKINEKFNIEKEKIKIQEKIIKENNKKIEEIKNKIKIVDEKYSEKNNNEKIIDKRKEKNKLKNKLTIIFIILIFINILWLIIIPKINSNKILKYIFIATIPIFLIVSSKIKNKFKIKIENIEKNNKNELEKINIEKNYLENEKQIIENSSKELLEKINKINSENEMVRNFEEYQLINK